ncbi:MAG: molybdenum cofactor guanylyltransferase [Microcoleaceae cyanobacterium]
MIFSVIALILAGGQSSRMGQDKALVLFRGQPLLRTVYDVAAICCETIALLTPWPERYVGILPENCQFLVESCPSQGPLLALAQGLGKIEADWILLLACDLPLLESKVLQTWIEQLAQVPESVLAVVPWQTSGWEPLCGFYRSTAQENLRRFIQQGGNSFQIWLSQIPTHPLPIDPVVAPMLRNCNTPEDLLSL